MTSPGEMEGLEEYLVQISGLRVRLRRCGEHRASI